MAERPAIFEPYSKTVGLDDVQDCLRPAHPPAHVAGSWHWLDGPGPVVPPTLWLLSAGDARGATEGFGLAGARTGPAGFASRRPPFGSVWSCSLTCLFYVRPWPSGFWVGGRPFGTR